MQVISKNEAIRKTLEKDIIKINFNNPKKKSETNKTKIRKIILKNKEIYQLEENKTNQVFHKNIEKNNLAEELNNLFDSFKDIKVITNNAELIFLQNKKGIIRWDEKNISNESIKDFDHNQEKNYIIPISNIPSFFKDLNIFTQDGKLIKSKSHKFKQINKYLEFIESVIPELKKQAKLKERLQIVDFGCGKAYLSFALYYYLNEIKKIPTEIYGLDLKESVIEFCNDLSQKCKFENLKFIKGDINTFEFTFNPDMIISLHACDIATDMALAKAVKINTPIIFAVPCCQKEINQQLKRNHKEIENPTKVLLEYGIISEKFSTLLTDTLRAKILEKNDYKVSVEEFIDIENTPKNILIKAIKTTNSKSQKNKEKIDNEINDLKNIYSIKLSLESMLNS